MAKNESLNRSSGNSSVILFNFFQYLTASSYVTIFLLGVSGNVATCYIMCCRLKRSATSVFLINLSVADLMMALFCVPMTLVSDCLILHWVFGKTMCQVFPFIQGVSVFLSALTHLAISVDRYFVVFRPLQRQHFPIEGAIIVISVVWILSILGSAPMIFVSVLVRKDKVDFCQELWDKEVHAVIYSMLVLVLQYFLPLTVIILSYSVIAIYLWFHRPPGESMQMRDEAIATSRRKMIKMFIIVAVFYSLSQLPRHIIFLRFLPPHNIPWDEVTIWVVNFTHLLSMSACVYNPILYIWLNTAFKKSFLQLFSFRKVSNQHSNPDRGLTTQENPYVMRRMLSISCNNMAIGNKILDRRGF